MNPAIFAASAAVLAVERVAYMVIWRRPDRFAALCHRLFPGRDPVDVLAALFAVFKVVQAAVFVSWCVLHGGSLSPASTGWTPIAGGGALLLVGQGLNLSVFVRLGRVGVFYGNRLGHRVSWCRGFPFSVVRHPQYVGTVLSIWGVFLVMRFPAPDWAVLPLLETLYYVMGAAAEKELPDSLLEPAPAPPAPATAAARHGGRRAR